MESLADEFVVAQLDTRNGRASFVTQLNLRRNRSYALVVAADGKILARLDSPRLLEEAVLLVDSVLPARASATLPGGKQADTRTGHALESLVLAVVRTSRVNSATDTTHFRRGPSGVQVAYRKAVVGQYVQIEFDRPRRIRSDSGDVTAIELVVAIAGKGQFSGIFAVDLDGRVVQFARFDDLRVASLVAAIQEATGRK